MNGKTARAALRGDHRPRQQEGQIIVLFAMAIVVILLFASLVIDLGLLRNNRQILVNAVDSAALAGGTKMPVDACNNPQSSTAACASINGAAWQAVRDLIIQTLQATYPGISASNYTISYRCLVGITGAAPPQPYISRDIPLVCNPRGALGHTPVAADFQGAGPTRYSACDPSLGDRCNVVVVTGATTTSYSFGRVVGVNEGSTGTALSAACNGPCGQPPSAPVDLVVLVDRTASMSSSQITNARNAAKAVLGVYDPALQRVAIGFLGPSEPNTSCNGSGGVPAVRVNAIDSSAPSAPSHSSSLTNVVDGATSLSISRPGAAGSAGVVFIAAITVNNSIRIGGSGNVQITAPAGWSHIRTTNNGNTIGLATYFKVATGTEGGSYQWTFTNPSTGNPMSVRATGGVSRYTGVDNTSPVNVDGGNTGSDTSLPTFNASASAVTTTRNNVALIAFHAMANGTGGTPTDYFGSWQNGMSQRFDRRGSNAAGPSVGAAHKTDTGAGGTGATQSTVSGGGSYAAQHVGLNPDFSNHYGTNYPTDLGKWIPIGFTGTDSDTPAQTWNEAYVDANGTLQNTTHIVSAINCFDNPGGTGTNLTTPIAMAAAYLQQYGRPNVRWGILFETDGEPNYGSTGDPGNYTCASAVAAATDAKAITNADGKHIELFTVGFFDAGSDPDCPDAAGTYYHNKNVTLALADMATTNRLPSPNGTANGCIADENADQDHFFCQPKTDDLKEVFSIIATEFAGIRTHLIQLSPPPYISNLTPSSGADSGGTVVTIDGKYFTGTTQVRFGGVNVAFTFVSDTQLLVTAPGGVDGSSVQIIVTNGGGSSLPHTGSRYTYT